MVAYREKVHVCQWRVKGTLQERVRGKKSQVQNQAPLRARDSSTRGSKRVITDDKIRIVRGFSSPATVGVCAGRRRASEDPACEFGELSGLRTRPAISYRIYRPSPYPLPRYSRSAIPVEREAEPVTCFRTSPNAVPSQAQRTAPTPGPRTARSEAARVDSRGFLPRAGTQGVCAGVGGDSLTRQRD